MFNRIFSSILLLFEFSKRTTDADALELYNKKVRIVNPKTGDVLGYNYFPPAVGIKKVQDGGKYYYIQDFAKYAIHYNRISSHSIALERHKDIFILLWLR